MLKKHQSQLIWAFVLAECRNLANALVAAFIDKNHFHLGGLVVAVSPGIDSLCRTVSVSDASSANAPGSGHSPAKTSKMVAVMLAILLGIILFLRFSLIFMQESSMGSIN